MTTIYSPISAAMQMDPRVAAFLTGSEPGAVLGSTDGGGLREPESPAPVVGSFTEVAEENAESKTKEERHGS